MSSTEQYQEGDVVNGFVPNDGQWLPETETLATEEVVEPARKSGKGKWVVVGALVLAILAVAGVAKATTGGGSGTTTVTGTLSVGAVHDNCARDAGSGFTDIADGTTVVLTDEKGTILGSGALTGGHAVDWVGCTYSFTVSGVPTEAKQYQVEVGHRGKVIDGAADLKTAGWHYDLHLGGN